MSRTARSLLFVPGSRPDRFDKALAADADAVVIDLEDAVAPDAKVTARAAACAAVASGEYGRKELTIRVNGVGTQWHDADLEAACAAGPEGIVVPKVGSAKAVKRLVEAMSDYRAPAHTKLWAMVETPEAILGARKLAAASPRLAVLVMGTNDLVKELDSFHVPGREPLMMSLSYAVLAARAAGIAIVDGVYNDVRDLEGFAAECRQGRAMGFDGKTLIHPGQVEPCNAVFAPSEEQVEDARGLIAAFEAGSAEGKGVVTYKNKLVENLHVETARKVLATRAAIDALG